MNALLHILRSKQIFIWSKNLYKHPLRYAENTELTSDIIYALVIKEQSWNTIHKSKGNRK